MLKDYLQKYYFTENYNCAEAMIHAANEYYNLGLHDKDMLMVAGFGAGMQIGHTCGAIIACVSILSLRYVKHNAHESRDITFTSQALLKRFNEKYNSLLCKDIKPQSFKPEYRCLRTIETACDILEEVILEFDNKYKNLL